MPGTAPEGFRLTGLPRQNGAIGAISSVGLLPPAAKLTVFVCSQPFTELAVSEMVPVAVLGI